MSRALRHPPNETPLFLTRDVDLVLESWDYGNCSTYDGHITVDVDRWLDCVWCMLDMRQAHPDIWHLVGFRLLEGPALDALNGALGSGNGPTDWNRFRQWANSLNPLASHVVKAYNQSVIADDYEMLRQGDDESAKAFYKRFSEWQLRAQHHRYKYEARSAFIDRLNNRLRSRVCTQMARYKQRAEPVNFSLLFLIVLEEDGQSD